MRKTRPKKKLEKELWNSSKTPIRNKAMRRADGKLAKFAADAPDATTYTLHEIAEVMGITRERVRQIEARALRKLHKRLSQVFKNEDITPEDALDMLRRGTPGGLEYTVAPAEEIE